MKISSIKTSFKIIAYGAMGVTVAVAFGTFSVLYFMKLITDLAFATGMLAIVTSILASLTYWSIRSRNTQAKRDRDERQVSMIIEWVTDVVNLSNDQVTKEISAGIWDDKTWPFIGEEAKKFNTFQSQSTRSKYMRIIAKRIDPKLGELTTNLSGHLITQVECLRKYINWVESYRKKETTINKQYLTSTAKSIADTYRHLNNKATKIFERAAEVITTS